MSGSPGGGAGGRGGAGGSAGASGTGGSAAGASGTGGRGGTTGAAGASGTGGRGGTAGSAGAAGATGNAGRGGTTGTAGSGTAGAGGAAGTGGSTTTLAPGPLRVDPTNPRYFNDGHGKIVYLVGSHTWGNFKDFALTDPPPAFDFAGYLDFLVAHNHNFIRLWSWEQPHSMVGGGEQAFRYITPFPYPRSGPGNANDGKPKFDMSQFDAAYFTRLRNRVVDAGNRGIYVSVMLFDGLDPAIRYNGTDGGFPYGSGNNINGVSGSGADFVSLSNTAVTQYQEAYVKKVIDTVNDLDNVLYEISNEPSGAGVVQWEYHFIQVVKQYEATKPKQHPVGMTSTYEGMDADLFASSADWISPINPRLLGDGRKVILNDTDHSYYWTMLQTDGAAAQRAWAWETLTLGASPLFMDPYLETREFRNTPMNGQTDPQWDTIRNAIGRTRIYANKLDLAHALPSASLASTGYCIANPGSQYLVYQPSSGAFTLTAIAGTYNYEWYNSATGTVAGSGSMAVAAGTQTFTPPFSGDAVLLLTR